MGSFVHFAFLKPKHRFSITTCFSNAFLAILPNGFVWLFYVFGVQFHIYVPDLGWPEPIRLQWKQLNRHKIIVKSTGEFTISTNFSGVEPLNKAGYIRWF